MKTLSFALLSLLIANSSAIAGIIDVTSSPTNYVLNHQCSDGNSDDFGPLLCVTATVLALPLFTTSSSVALLKEEVESVQQDAHNFLAGEALTLALSEVMDKVRAQVTDMAELSNEEIATALIEAK